MYFTPLCKKYDEENRYYSPVINYYMNSCGLKESLTTIVSKKLVSQTHHMIEELNCVGTF